MKWAEICCELIQAIRRDLLSSKVWQELQARALALQELHL